jgi:hypothetical protein
VPQAEQQRGDLLALAREFLSGGSARPRQLADGLVADVGLPHGRQLTGPQEARQAHRITPIGLYPVAGLIRGQRWRNHKARVPEPFD